MLTNKINKVITNDAQSMITVSKAFCFGADWNKAIGNNGVN
jgi:hypothetical protein